MACDFRNCFHFLTAKLFESRLRRKSSVVIKSICNETVLKSVLKFQFHCVTMYSGLLLRFSVLKVIAVLDDLIDAT